MGDLPIFVAHDSADVWAHRELFRLDADGHPTVVAGVPPDYFSATGQLWGNPHYRWDVLERTGYAWWVARFRALLTMVDHVRIDHFRGFEASWEVPRGAVTAVNGQWVQGPGIALFRAVQAALATDHLPFVAENLGVITPAVEALREQLDLPGMAILQFAFGTDPQAPDFRPHNYPRRTRRLHRDARQRHDGRLVDRRRRPHDAIARGHRRRARATPGAICRPTARRSTGTSSALCSPRSPRRPSFRRRTCLGLGSEARMNQPGTPSGNWRWRLQPGQLSSAIAERLAGLTETFDRLDSRA